MSPQPGLAIFKGTPGVVTVDGSAHSVSATGLQFSVDGYTLAGDALWLAADTNNTASIDVGDGTSASASYKATISNVLTGDVGLNKVDFGTLVLTRANTYSGATDINAGKLALVGDGSIADSTGVVVDGAGTLDITGTTNGASIDGLAGSGSIVLGGKNLVVSNDSSFEGVISGSGGLTVTNGFLILDGQNTYTGLTTVDSDGHLQVGALDPGSVAGDILDNGTLTFFVNSADQSYGGVISGTGSVAKSGAGTLALTGANTFTGGLWALGDTENSSKLAISSDANLGAAGGAVLLEGGALEATTSFTLTHPLTLVSAPTPVPSTLQVDSGATLTVANGIAGDSSADLVKTGPGTLVLAAINGYGGSTTISEGTLALAGTGSLANSSGVRADGTFDISGATGGAATVVQSLSGSGAVTLGAQTLMLSNASGNFSGVISGSGALLLFDGTEILTGANTYSGGTTIQAGVLQVSSDANLGATTGHVKLDGGTLQAGGSFTLSHDIDAVLGGGNIDTNGHALTLSGAISGDAMSFLVKQGAGTLTITSGTDVNTYTGETTIAGGTLALVGDGSIANSRIVGVASGATLDISGTTNGATINLLNGEGSVRLGGKMLTVTGDPGFYFGGVISGTGNVTVAGGTLALTSANTYTGGTTIDAGATLQLDNSGVGSGSIAGDVVDNGVLTFFGGGGNVTFGGAISGTGAVDDSVSSTSTLILTGINTYSGGTAVNTGTLAVSSDANLGAASSPLTLGTYGTLETTASFTMTRDVVLELGQESATIQTDPGTDLTTTGLISGSGSLFKTGAGVLTLDGTDTWTGGSAVLDGSFRSTHTLPGDVSVHATAILDAVPGVAGSLYNYAKVTVEGGDTTVGGNYTQGVQGVAGGTLAISLGSKLAVTGTATLNGGTLEVTGADSGYVANTHTDVLTATGGVTGTFDQLVKDSGVVFTSTTIGYGTNDVYLDTTGLSITVAASEMGIAEPAAVSAAQRVQTGFETINATMASGGTPSSSALEGAGAIQHSATPAVAQATLESLSGQLHAASAAMLFDGIDANGNALSEHFDDLLSGRSRTGVWYGDLGWQGNLQRSGYTGATFRSSGGMAGADMRIGAHALLGFAAGQSLGFGQLDTSWDHDRTWMNNIAAYGGLTNGAWYANAQVASGWYREDMQRLLQLGALGSLVGTGTTGSYVAGALEGGRMFRIGNTRIVPFADVRYQRLGLGGFSEQGGLGYGLEADARTVGRLQAGLGLRAERGWQLANGMQMAFDGTAGLQHTLHQHGEVFDASFTSFNDWLPVQGIGLSRDTATLRAGLSLWPTRNFGIRAGYMLEQGEREHAGSAMLQGTVAF
ncbi:MAG TPA: autotransporter-associated beta strand repeat-containing protein [Rhodanobacteraceae bacterium]|nr:autotransporter-associated beta strand repeat-containing protein [Rhodanobacteraceae bacterium]